MREEEFYPLLSPLSAEEAAALTRQTEHLLVQWYQTAARDLPWRKSRDPYHIWVSEIMLQQTRVEAVIPYYHRFLDALPDIPSLAAAPEEQLHKLWEGLGYYSRVRNLQKAAKQVVELYGGSLPADYDRLLKLCGIGEYTAGAITSIAFGQAVPAVDGNVLRVMSRILAAEGDILSPAVKKAYRTLLAEQMLPDHPGEFNQAIMDLGAGVCLPNGEPHCESCPVRTVCLAFERGQQRTFPVKAPKRKRRVEKRTVLLLINSNDEVLLRKRPDDGLLAGLWEFPHKEGLLSRDEIISLLKERGISFQKLQTLKPAKHIFTHIEWQMTGYLIRCDVLPAAENEVLAGTTARAETYTIPNAFAAFKKVLDTLEE